MKEESQEDFSKLEDDIIILLNKLSKTIDTFNTLSRDQAEKAILETNSNIKECKEIIDKMEEYIKEHESDDEIDKNELNKKILNYKTEYHEILNKYNSVQDNYINKKTENALMEEDNDKDLVDDDDKNKDNKKKNKEELIVDGELNEKKNNNKRQINDKKEGNNNKDEISLINVNNNKDNILENNNNSQVLNYSLNPKINIETDEAFNQINKDYDIKKKKIVCICVAICVFIFLIIILSATLSRK